jgi:hypothetical protein
LSSLSEKKLEYDKKFPQLKNYDHPFKDVVDMMNLNVDDLDLKLYLSLYWIAEHDELPLQSAFGIEFFAAAAAAARHLPLHPNSV